MINVFSKYKRGDVWFIKFQTEDGDGIPGSSVQKKSRPYVIVSCEENNNNAPVFQVCPIATMSFDHLPPHVYFKNGNRDQVVECEQITTISVLDFQREGSRFLYSFSLEFMNKIDDALAGQLGLKVRVSDMKVLENLVEKLAADKEEKLKKKYEESIQIRIEELAQRLSKQFGIELNSQDMLNGLVYKNPDLEYAPKELKSRMTETAKERMTPPILSKREEIKKEVLTVENPPRRKHQSWTDIQMKQFLKDYKEISLQEISDKYGISKKSIASMAWSFRKKLGIEKS